ncbi:methylated-DNA--[protein]-cysteine S-methyltransferase [Nocardiopsis tropica]|uniref:methylated-DNA--[protein]-cysteine S-methyltransferase n=1 Tax=Tsukamurella strandjordii TaxID=147577 RepID=UPI0031D803D2
MPRDIAPGYALFDTAVGRCGIAWNGEGTVTAVRLPEESDERMRSFVAKDGVAETTPPQRIQTVIDAVVALTAGADLTDDLTWVALDMNGLTDFQRAVYEVARRIPPGQTRTYGDIANEIGLPGSARAVGRALGDNPFPPVVPCHRVTAAGGRTGGFSASGGVNTKMRLLSIEQAVLGLW